MKKLPVDLFGWPIPATVAPRPIVYGDPRDGDIEPDEFGDFPDDDWETPGGTMDDLS